MPPSWHLFLYGIFVSAVMSLETTNSYENQGDIRAQENYISSAVFQPTGSNTTTTSPGNVTVVEDIKGLNPTREGLAWFIAVGVVSALSLFLLIFLLFFWVGALQRVFCKGSEPDVPELPDPERAEQRWDLHDYDLIIPEEEMFKNKGRDGHKSRTEGTRIHGHNIQGTSYGSTSGGRKSRVRPTTSTKTDKWQQRTTSSIPEAEEGAGTPQEDSPPPPPPPLPPTEDDGVFELPPPPPKVEKKIDKMRTPSSSSTLSKNRGVLGSESRKSNKSTKSYIIPKTPPLPPPPIPGSSYDDDSSEEDIPPPPPGFPESQVASHVSTQTTPLLTQTVKVDADTGVIDPFPDEPLPSSPRYQVLAYK